MKTLYKICRFCKTSFKPTIGKPYYCSIHCRFWDKVIKSTPEQCWEYQGPINIDGYGKFSIKKIEIKAHRFSWEELYGHIPDGMCVLHKCDNAPCVNPNHLFLGTRLDNLKDMFLKGRNPSQKGELNPAAKLTNDEVIAIRILLSYGMRLTAIARSYNRGVGTIFDIKHGRTWTHI